MGALITLLVVTTAIGLGQWYLAQRRMRQQFDKTARPLDDPPLEAAIRRLGRVAGVEDLRAQVVDLPMINGLATPDGRILLTRGLLERYRFGAIDVAEIASVVAHELGHVALGHHQRRLIDYTGQNAVRMVLMVLLNRFVPFVGIYIAAWLGNLVMAGLSRRDEFEADRYATALLLKAGFGHGPQIEMFRKLSAMTPDNRAPAWMMSHPDTDQRIAAIEANARAWGSDRALQGDPV